MESNEEKKIDNEVEVDEESITSKEKKPIILGKYNIEQPKSEDFKESKDTVNFVVAKSTDNCSSEEVYTSCKNTKRFIDISTEEEKQQINRYPETTDMIYEKEPYAENGKAKQNEADDDTELKKKNQTDENILVGDVVSQVEGKDEKALGTEETLHGKAAAKKEKAETNEEQPQAKNDKLTNKHEKAEVKDESKGEQDSGKEVSTNEIKDETSKDKVESKDKMKEAEISATEQKEIHEKQRNRTNSYYLGNLFSMMWKESEKPQEPPASVPPEPVSSLNEVAFGLTKQDSLWELFKQELNDEGVVTKQATLRYLETFTKEKLDNTELKNGKVIDYDQMCHTIKHNKEEQVREEAKKEDRNSKGGFSWLFSGMVSSLDDELEDPNQIELKNDGVVSDNFYNFESFGHFTYPRETEQQQSEQQQQHIQQPIEFKPDENISVIINYGRDEDENGHDEIAFSESITLPVSSSGEKATTENLTFRHSYTSSNASKKESESSTSDSTFSNTFLSYFTNSMKNEQEKEEEAELNQPFYYTSKEDSFYINKINRRQSLGCEDMYVPEGEISRQSNTHSVASVARSFFFIERLRDELDSSSTTDKNSLLDKENKIPTQSSMKKLKSKSKRRLLSNDDASICSMPGRVERSSQRNLTTYSSENKEDNAPAATAPLRIISKFHSTRTIHETKKIDKL